MLMIRPDADIVSILLKIPLKVQSKFIRCLYLLCGYYAAQQRPSK
jgi:hypothetical protein